MVSLGPISFAAPLALIGFLALPVIWWLLRLKPPAPLLVRFPAVRILAGLTGKRDTPALMPWWLLILRLVLASLIILAASHPLWDSGKRLSNLGPVYLIIDDDWSAAARWQAKRKSMLSLIDQAEREDRSVIVLTTAANASGVVGDPIQMTTPIGARRMVSGLQPKPWATARLPAINRLLMADFLDDERPGDVVWFTNGMKNKKSDFEALIKRLRRIGAVSVVADPPANLPVVLRAPAFSSGKLDVRAERISAGTGRSIIVQALGDNGQILLSHPVLFGPGEGGATASIDLPIEIYNRIERLQIEDAGTVGGIVLLDERWRRRPVGVQSSAASETAQPLLTPAHYLKKALEPFSEVRTGSISDLLQLPLAVIAIADTNILSEENRKVLAEWAHSGGTIIRFAGPALSRGVTTADPLLPVKLRQGNRIIGGAMSWSKPAKLAAFPGNSPFFGLPVSDEIEVRRQVLARPSPDLAEKTWARLSDGTPLVTAERRGEGWIILVHTTANLDWSNLSISGLFVDMLRRIVDLSQGVSANQDDVPLSPLSLMDAFGNLQKPGGAAKAIASSTFDDEAISADHPPGIYGTQSLRQAHNLSTRINLPVAIGDLPGGIRLLRYDDNQAYDLRAGLLMAALIMFIVDGLIALALCGGVFIPRTMTGVVIIMAVGLVVGDVQADTLSFARENSLDTRLAYVLSGDPDFDDISRLGLRGLTTVLAQRTAAELGPPEGVDPATDDLSFFPLLYWPVPENFASNDVLMAERIRTYMKNGGTILFDTRAEGPGGGGNSRALRQFAEDIGLPRLVPVPSGHVLSRAFYLLKSFPGRWTGGTLWIERAGERVNDGVSPVIVGSHDWAGAWAMDDGGLPLFAVVPGGEAQRELAFRFGINLVMYTLTGNYKADQVHLPAIMQRLGQ